MPKGIFKKSTLCLPGGFILVLGIALILAYWQDVVILFRGIIGLALALAGLLILYSLDK